jgi:uncharacterized membrane protein
MVCLKRGTGKELNKIAIRIIQIIILIFIVFTSSFPILVHAEYEPVPLSLSLMIYSDGYVLVKYKIELDQTEPAVNITLYGEIFEDVTIVDHEGLPLDYLFTNGNVTIFSLGSNETTITYNTQDLTSKEGRYWTLDINIKMISSIILPEEASISNINRLPEAIESIDGKVLLIMSQGTVQMTYVIGVVGTRVHAQIVLNDAENTINQIKELGILVTEAETKLQEAIEEFDNENYAQAEALGYEAKDIAVQTNATATEAQLLIEEASSEIHKAENEGRILGLSEARNLIESANTAYSNGNYEQASILANQSKAQAIKSQKPFPLEIIAVVLTLVVSISIIVFRLRKKPINNESLKKERIIDTQKILKKHDLREEEIEAIKFLVGKGGEAFEAELFKNLNIPRTTVWRMIRRLEKVGIIRIDKFRRQNLIVINKRYEKKR